MTLESACPTCKRPYSLGELALKRHIVINRLRDEGHTLMEIAVRVGMKTPASVWHHTSERCKCLE